MMAAKDKDPKVWDNYSKWALNSFSSVYRQVGNDMNDIANRPWIDIKWNPSASQFEVSPTAEGTAMANKDPNGAGGSVVRYLEGRMGLTSLTLCPRSTQASSSLSLFSRPMASSQMRRYRTNPVH